MKNNCAPPFRQVEFDIQYDEGITHTGLLVDLGVEHNIVDEFGSWFSYGDLRRGQGKQKSRLFPIENPDITDEIETRVWAALGLPGEVGTEAAATSAGFACSPALPMECSPVRSLADP